MADDLAVRVSSVVSKESVDFWKPRFVGGRFESHALPLEVLKDLAALEELLVETAKWRFLDEHKDRQRVPKGFMEAVTLSLNGVGQGSTVPFMVLEYENGGALFPPETKKYFDDARNLIIQTVRQAEQGVKGYALPEKLLGFFDRIGRSLRGSESLEFDPSNKRQPARLQQATRKVLVLASQSVQSYSEEVLVRGTIPEIDLQRSSFTLCMLDGRRVEAPLLPHLVDTVLDAVNRFSRKTKVLVQGVGIRNRMDMLQKLESIEHISLLDPLDLGARLEELSLLADGWLDGKGKGFLGSPWRDLARLLEDRYPETLPLPYLYPTAEGTILAEWNTVLVEVSMEIELSTLQSEYQVINTVDGTSFERGILLSDPVEWEDFIGLLAGHLRSSK